GELLIKFCYFDPLQITLKFVTASAFGNTPCWSVERGNAPGVLHIMLARMTATQVAEGDKYGDLVTASRRVTRARLLGGAGGGLGAGNAQALAPLPEAFSADAQFARQF